MKINDLSFEEAAVELEKIIDSFNDEDLPLNKAVSNYEHGIELYNYCKELIDKAENRIIEIKGNLKG